MSDNNEDMVSTWPKVDEKVVVEARIQQEWARKLDEMIELKRQIRNLENYVDRLLGVIHGLVNLMHAVTGRKD